MEELNPYNPNTKDITLSTIHADQEEAWYLFYKFKKRNEKLGLAHLSKKELHFSTPYFYESIRTFLNEGINLPYEQILNYKNKNNLYSYQVKSEMYSKLAWLTKDFLLKGKFDNPIGALYNPDILKYNIHPGGTRQIILQHFYTLPTIETLCFNTGGKKTKFDITFDSVDVLLDYFKGKNVAMSLSPDKGSLIPHIHFNEHLNIDIAKKYHFILKDFFENTYINANFSLQDWGYTFPSNPTKSCTIYITPQFMSENNQALSLLMAPVVKQYKFEHIYINM